MINASDRRFMALALSLGRRGLGQQYPYSWPAVGCVIVRDGVIVGRGWSSSKAMQHAEVAALKQAGEAARGADVFVTLEPCAHHGNTPPCANALVDAGVARVVAACGDPNPKVAGKGFAILRAAGIVVETGLMEDEAKQAHAGFLSHQFRKRPYVTLKLATTLDGKIATASGDSQWITGPWARRVVHGLRMRHEAVLVGAGTVRDDDPNLLVRDMGVLHQPVRVVASTRLKIPRDGQLIRTAQDHPVWLLHGAGAPTDGWGEARLFSVPEVAGQLSATGILEVLGREGITSVFCEGGGMLAASLLGQGLVDELIVFNGGRVIGAEGRPATGPLGISALAEAPRFERVEVRQVGADVMQRWRA